MITQLSDGPDVLKISKPFSYTLFTADFATFIFKFIPLIATLTDIFQSLLEHGYNTYRLIMELVDFP